MSNNKRIKVAGNELQFFRENAPSMFVALIVDQLKDEGCKVGRPKVNHELYTVKHDYDERVIIAARLVLKKLKGLEYQGQ